MAFYSAQGNIQLFHYVGKGRKIIKRNCLFVFGKEYITGPKKFTYLDHLEFPKSRATGMKSWLESSSKSPGQL